jgi:hypothetical protein
LPPTTTLAAAQLTAQQDAKETATSVQARLKKVVFIMSSKKRVCV